MLRRSNKDSSNKVSAVIAVLNQLSHDTLKWSSIAVLKKFHETALYWTEVSAAELERRSG